MADLVNDVKPQFWWTAVFMLYYALNIYEHTFSHWAVEKNGFGVRQGFTVCKVLMVLIMIKKVGE